MKRLVVSALSAAVIAGLSTTAFASSCPLKMKEIDAALAKNPQLSEMKMNEVKKLRAEGEAQHKAGDHAASVATLKKAKEILGLGM